MWSYNVLNPFGIEGGTRTLISGLIILQIWIVIMFAF